MKVKELRDLLYKVDSDAEVKFKSETNTEVSEYTIDRIQEQKDFKIGEGYEPVKTIVYIIEERQ